MAEVIRNEEFLDEPSGKAERRMKNEEGLARRPEGESQFATARNSRKARRGVLVVAHRRELLDQIRGTVKYFGIDMEKEHVVVESIQKLSRILGHTDNIKSKDNKSHTDNTDSTDFSSTRIATNDHEFSINPSLVIIDEAHHALARTYRMLWERWPKAKFLGLTATPCRLNNEGFLDLFQTMVQSHTIQEFIQMAQ